MSRSSNLHWFSFQAYTYFQPGEPGACRHPVRIAATRPLAASLARRAQGLSRRDLRSVRNRVPDHYRAPVLVIADNTGPRPIRSEEHTSELQSLMRISYAVFCLKKKKHPHNVIRNYHKVRP